MTLTKQEEEFVRELIREKREKAKARAIRDNEWFKKHKISKI